MIVNHIRCPSPGLLMVQLLRPSLFSHFELPLSTHMCGVLECTYLSGALVKHTVDRTLRSIMVYPVFCCFLLFILGTQSGQHRLPDSPTFRCLRILLHYVTIDLITKFTMFLTLSRYTSRCTAHQFRYRKRAFQHHDSTPFIFDTLYTSTGTFARR